MSFAHMTHNPERPNPNEPEHHPEPQQQRAPESTSWWKRGLIGKIIFFPHALTTTITGDNGLIGRTASFVTHPATLAAVTGGVILGAGANNEWFTNATGGENLPTWVPGTSAFRQGTADALQYVGSGINTVGGQLGSYAAQGGEIAAKTATSISNTLQIPEHARGFAQWYQGPQAVSPEA